MDTGELKDSVNISKPSTHKDQYGAEKVAYLSFGKLRGRFVYKRARISQSDTEIQKSVSAEFHIRYNARLSDSLRLSFQNKQYNIVGLLHFIENRETVIQLEEVK